MTLDDLLKTIETLRERAQNHKSLLERNESQTRYSLIDPLLRVLGWDTEDPEQVRVEESSGVGKSDYMLIEGGDKKICLEAKSLGQNIEDPHVLNQALTYANSQGVPWLAVTNGTQWAIYTVFEQKQLTQRKTTSWDILKDNPGEAACKALVLWRPNRGRVPAPPPIIKPPPPKEGWMRLTELADQVKKGRMNPPQKMRFPDGKEAPISSWKSLLEETAKWLHGQGKLPSSVISRTRCIVNTEPKHPSGHKFRSPKQIGKFFIELHASARHLVHSAVRLINESGLDPADFWVLPPSLGDGAGRG